MTDWTKPDTCQGCRFAETHFDVIGCSLLKRAVIEPECTPEEYRNGILRKDGGETNAPELLPGAELA